MCTKRDDMNSDEIYAPEHARRAVVGRTQADIRTLAFPVPRRERVLNAMRNAWKAAQPEFKDSIVAVGQAVKVL
jgi:hypothetical protein